MSISENSTLLANNRENEGSYQLLDDRYNSGPTVNAYDKSPYTDPDFVTLDVGPNHTIYRIHRIVLSQSSELEVKPFSKLWGDKTSESIALPEIDESTAHTLVHYLYSGLYQTLYSHDPSVKGGSLAAYKLGTCVYVASIRYKLPGLSDLSKEQINVSSEDLSILDILSVAREHAFPHLPVDEQWYPEYLEAAINAAFTKDAGFFTTGEFVDQLEGDRRFRQVVMKAVVGTLSSSKAAKKDVEEVVEVVDQSRVETPVLGATEHHAYEEIVEPEREPEPELEPLLPPALQLEPAVEPEPTSIVSLEGDDNDLILDAIEPTPSPPTEPEPFTDEVGFGTSQTYRSFSRTNSSTEPPVTFPREIIETEAKRPTHERVDSLLQDVESLSLGSPEEELAALEANETPISPAAKKNRKKKNKKIAAAAAAAAEAAALASLDGPVIANEAAVA